MSATEKLRVGMVGVGGFGNFRRERMRETGLFDLVAAYDLNPEALKRAQDEDGAKSVSSYQELLDTPGIEAVIIATGAKFHAAQALLAMQKGLHVFMEKPLCSTAAELKALLAAHRQTHVIVGVGHHDHSHDAVSTITKRMIDSGELGKLAAVEMTTAHSGGLQIRLGDWRGDPERNPGGMLFQCGVHAIHEMLFYFGPITEVFSMMRYDVHTTATADAAICALKFESGLIGVLNAYHVTPYRHMFHLFGTRANLYREELCFDEGTRLWRQRIQQEGKKEPREPVAIEGDSDPCGNLRSFYKAVRECGAPYPSLLDGARAVAVVFACEESARSARVAKVAGL